MYGLGPKTVGSIYDTANMVMICWQCSLQAMASVELVDFEWQRIGEGRHLAWLPERSLLLHAWLDVLQAVLPGGSWHSALLTVEAPLAGLTIERSGPEHGGSIAETPITLACLLGTIHILYLMC
jgi:hypothetical protein